MANPGAATSSTVNTVATYNGLQLLFVLANANLAISNQDQQFTRVFTGLTWDPQYITAVWKSGAAAGSPTGGIYPSPSRGGTGIVSSTQSYNGLTGAFTHVNCLIQATTTTFTSVPYFNVNAASSSALVADFRIYGFCYDL